MKSKASVGTFLGSAVFLFFLSTAIPAFAQSVGEEVASKPQQLTNSMDAKAPAPADAGKAMQTKSFTLEGEKVWVDTEISLEPGQRIVVNSKG